MKRNKTAILNCSLLISVCLSCTKNDQIKLTDIGSFTVPAGADIGITARGIETIERYPDFFFDKRYEVNAGSFELVSMFKDSSRQEPARKDYVAFYDSLTVPVNLYASHPDFNRPKSILIGEQHVDNLAIDLYKDEKDWGIYLMVRNGKASDSVLVSKMSDGCMAADFLLHDFTGDGRPEIVVISRCVIGVNEIERITVCRID